MNKEEIKEINEEMKRLNIGWMITTLVCSFIGFGAGYILWGVILK